MKRKAMITLMLTGILSTIAPSLIAQRGPGYGYRNVWPEVNIPGLTQEQKDKIQSIRLENAKGIRDLSNRIMEKKAALRTEVQQDKPNQKRINQLLEEAYALKLDLAKNRLQSRLQIREQLTDEQKLYFDSRATLRKRPMMNQYRNPLRRDIGRFRRSQ